MRRKREQINTWTVKLETMSIKVFLIGAHQHIDISEENSDRKVSSPLDPCVLSSSGDNTALQTQSEKSNTHHRSPQAH